MLAHVTIMLKLKQMMVHVNMHLMDLNVMVHAQMALVLTVLVNVLI